MGRNVAVAEYLYHTGYPGVGEAFVEAAGVDYDKRSKYSASLERKWTSLLKLSKKIRMLQAELDEAKALLALGPIRKPAAEAGFLPAATATYEMRAHRDEISSLVFHPTEPVLVTGGYDSTVRFTDYETGESLGKPLRESGAVSAVAVDASGSLLASASVSSIRVWQWESRKRLKSLTGHEADVWDVAFTPDASHLVSASRDTTVRVWTLDTGFCVKILSGHSEWVRSVSVAPNGEVYASAGADNTVCVWGADDSAPRAVLSHHSHVVEVVAFAPATASVHLAKLQGVDADEPTVAAAQYVASGGRDAMIHVYDAAAGALVASFAGHDGWVRDLAFHPCGEFLLSCGDDKSVRVWSLASGKCVKTYTKAHSVFVGAMAFNVRSPVVATGDVSGGLKIWNCVAP